MSAPEITIYTGPACPFCERAKQLLERKGAVYEEIRIDQDPDGFAAMMERSGGRKSVPQIFIGARHVGGFDDIAELNQDGALDALLAGE